VTEKDSFQEAMRHHAFFATMSHLLAASRRIRRPREKRAKRKLLLRLLIPAQPPKKSPADPLKVAVLAIDDVGRASVRACFTGTEIHVAAPDEATASVLRDALAETARARATDRLIRIVVGSP
jgi:hypothetical protein